MLEYHSTKVYLFLFIFIVMYIFIASCSRLADRGGSAICVLSEAHDAQEAYVKVQKGAAPPPPPPPVVRNEHTFRALRRRKRGARARVQNVKQPLSEAVRRHSNRLCNVSFVVSEQAGARGSIARGPSESPHGCSPYTARLLH